MVATAEKINTQNQALAEPTASDAHDSGSGNSSIDFGALVRSKLRCVNHELLELGYSICLKERESGKKRVAGWIKQQVPDAQKEVNDARAIAQLADSVPQYIDQMLGWGRSALATLAKGYRSLAQKIIKKINNIIGTLGKTVEAARYSAECTTTWILWGQQLIQACADLLDNLITTALAEQPKPVRAIRELLGLAGAAVESSPYLAPEKEATDAEWQQLIWDKYEVCENSRDRLQEYATELARQEADPEGSQITVKVAHIQSTLEHYKEILKPIFSHRRSGRSGAAPISMKDYNELMEQLQTQRKQIEALKQENAQLQTPTTLIQPDNELYQKALEQVRTAYAAEVAQVRSELARVGTSETPDDEAQSDLSNSSVAETEIAETAQALETVLGRKLVSRNLDIHKTLRTLSQPVLELLQQLIGAYEQVSSSVSHFGENFYEDFGIVENQTSELWEPA